MVERFSNWFWGGPLGPLPFAVTMILLVGGTVTGAVFWSTKHEADRATYTKAWIADCKKLCHDVDAPYWAYSAYQGCTCSTMKP